mmetsp:Transcript_20405/g.39433  ORF Transcript_20405/g.39433 Transcript_20405/m.39433 type:complete len:248 (+) Transcript_20405:73-816(+)
MTSRRGMPSSFPAEHKELKRNLRELHQKRLVQNRDFDECQKFCERLPTEKKPNHRGLVKRYMKAVKDAADEMTLAQTCLQNMVRYVEHRIEEIYQNNADIWTHAGTGRILPDGSKVAARTSENLWMLYLIDHYLPAPRNRYDVVDADSQQPMEERKHKKLEPSKLIPLPDLDEYPLNKRRIFKPGEWCFAIYPGTTAFYRAKVIQIPNKRESEPKYKLQFEEDDGAQRDVKVVHVAPLPELVSGQQD